MKPLILTTAIALAISSTAEAKMRKPVDANGNPIGHFICGLKQREFFGIADKKYNIALNWASFPHVSAQVGAVVVQRRKGRALGGGPGGHVSRIVELKGACRAIVADEKGSYERDICKSLVAYVLPSGSRVAVASVYETTSGALR